MDGTELLEELTDTVADHLILPSAAAETIALWVVFSHAHDYAEISPVLGITSPTPECGKTTLLTFLQCVVRRPLPASNITAAALFRAVEKWEPTLLIDEADTFLKESDELRGILNSGHQRRNAFVIRTTGESHEPKRFHTWSPKAIALIGKLPPTLASRAIHIELRRKTAAERITPLRFDRLEHLDHLARQAARWVVDNAIKLRKADPKLPSALNGRLADNWRPLIALADIAGNDWPARARRVAERLNAGRIEETAHIMLLEDIRKIFAARKGDDQIATAKLIEALVAMEDRPWPEWKGGKPITPRQLARLLEAFEIAPKQLWTGQGNQRGYEASQFSDAFTRYLSASPLERGEETAFSLFDPLEQNRRLADWEDKKSRKTAASSGLADKTPGSAYASFEIEERAGILEYDGGLSREEAEAQALAEFPDLPGFLDRRAAGGS